MPTILTNSDVSFTATFTLNTATKKLNITDATDYAGASIPLTGVKGVIKAVSPSASTFYNNTNFASPDVTRDVSATSSTTIPLPLLASGLVEPGNYDITYEVRITDGVNPVYKIEATQSYTFEYVAPEVSIEQTVNCVSPLFTSEDETDYDVEGVTPTITRTHTVYYPNGSAGQGSPLSGATATISTSTFYNGTQTTTISSILTYTFGDGLIVIDTVTGSSEVVVDCTFICSIGCCLRTLSQQLEDARCNNRTRYNELKDVFAQVMGYVQLTYVSIWCGRQDDVNTYITKIKTLANCTDDCSCDDEFSLVTGVGGGSVNAYVVDSAGAPITVQTSTVGDTTTFTLVFDQTLVTKINNLHNSTVSSNDGTITVNSTTAADGTVNYDLSHVVTFQNRQEFRVNVAYTAVPDVTVTGADYYKVGSNLGTTDATVVSQGFGTDPLWASKNNLFRVYGFQNASNDDYKIERCEVITSTSGATAGTMYLAADDYDIRVINQSSGGFYFQIIHRSTGLPLTNGSLAGKLVNFIVNIAISE